MTQQLDCEKSFACYYFDLKLVAGANSVASELLIVSQRGSPFDQGQVRRQARISLFTALTQAVDFTLHTW